MQTGLHFLKAHNQHNCWLSNSWIDLRCDSFRKECVWLRENSRPTRCVNILTVLSDFFPRVSVHFCVAWRLSLSDAADWLASLATIPHVRSPHFCPSFPSFKSPLFQQAFIYTPTPVAWAQAGGQAGSPAAGPDGALASQPALGLWAGRMAGRPFCGRYGGGQSWHLFVTMEQQGDGKAGTQREQCQYTADWGTNCGRTLAHRHVTLQVQFQSGPLDGVMSKEQKLRSGLS